MALDKATLKLALKLVHMYERDWLNYQAECEQYRKDKYRPHYCEHGTDLWTDYDNICGPCEDGITMRDPMQRRAHAIAEAKSRIQRFHDIITWITRAETMGLIGYVDRSAVYEHAYAWLHP